MATGILKTLSAAMVYMALPFTLQLTIFFVAPATAYAQARSSELPDNARKKGYGGGWECNDGFQEKAGTCVAIIIPEGAHLDYSGNDWECGKRHRRQGDKCLAV